MAPTLTSYLSIGGLGLDFLGAALLAYDALFGAEARQQASNRRARLAVAREYQERYARRLRELSESGGARENEAQSAGQGRVKAQMQLLTEVMNASIGELRHWEEHEHRVQYNAIVGLLLLMLGFACQGLSALLI